MIPETGLMVAVVERALKDLAGDIEYDVINKRRVAGEARAWFFSHDQGPFSFEWMCEQLDWDPDLIRSVIEKEEIRLEDPEVTKAYQERGERVQRV